MPQRPRAAAALTVTGASSLGVAIAPLVLWIANEFAGLPIPPEVEHAIAALIGAIAAALGAHNAPPTNRAYPEH